MMSGAIDVADETDAKRRSSSRREKLVINYLWKMSDLEAHVKTTVRIVYAYIVSA